MTRRINFTLASGEEISRALFLELIRPLDIVGAESRAPLSQFIRFWEKPGARGYVPTHFEQAAVGGPYPVDLSAEKVGLIPRNFERLLELPGTRGEIRRNPAAKEWEGSAAELLMQWAARFYKGYDLMGAVRSVDIADEILRSIPAGKHPLEIWCSQSVFLFNRQLSPGMDIRPGYDAEKDGVSPEELQGMFGSNWPVIARWAEV